MESLTTNNEIPQLYIFLMILYMILGALNIGISVLTTNVKLNVLGLGILCIAILMFSFAQLSNIK